jgi:hypothetical protein
MQTVPTLSPAVRRKLLIWAVMFAIVAVVYAVAFGLLGGHASGGLETG